MARATPDLARTQLPARRQFHRLSAAGSVVGHFPQAAVAVISAAFRLHVAVLGALLWFPGLAGQATEPIPSPQDQRIQAFSLPDQFRQEHRVVFTNAPVRLLTVADQKGAERLGPWIDAVKERFGTNLAMIAVADVSKVPRLLRGFVRGKFVERYPYPVLLDFSGDTVSRWTPMPDTPNLYLLATDGRVLWRRSGSAAETDVASLLQAAERNGVKAVVDATP